MPVVVLGADAAVIALAVGISGDRHERVRAIKAPSLPLYDCRWQLGASLRAAHTTGITYKCSASGPRGDAAARVRAKMECWSKV